jgi:uncharacterized protein involved in response to NO
MQRSLLVPDGPRGAAAPPRLALAAKGFRPFFLLAAVYAAAIVPLWLLALAGRVQSTDYLPGSVWHAHEMIFGFAVAVIAGFLLTAVGNWTGRETATGSSLLALAALWVAGRGAILFPHVLPRALDAALDLAFLPALAITLARPLVAARNRRNFVMIAIVGALFVADAVVHADALGIWPGAGRGACLVALDLVVLVILVITGRVVPMFTRNATGVTTIRSMPRLDMATVAAMAALTVLDAVMLESTVAAIASAIVGALAIARSWRWWTLRIFRHPLLWILHLGHAWVAAGLLLRAAVAIDPTLPASAATHALTVGAIGSLTLGMMARVALGHTGRPLTPPRTITFAFGAVTLAAILRVAGPIVLPSRYMATLVAAGALWTAAFAAYVLIYAPIVWAPRVDGRPG